ncbi:hypothetical protein [Pseudonocardia sp.]|uniref:hypothetical protein n=1 Tax=Pseudonocardia sp. TaxID=60912 RepID=UPI0026348309|nr:hypothetical protein [Pseudonocardia sp.]
MPSRTAAELAEDTVARVRDDPLARLAVLCELYRGGPGDRHLPYRRAAVAFLSWQLRRGLLHPPQATPAGSPWWRAVNERLIRDGYEARALAEGRDPAGSTPSAAASLEFVRHPSARSWYRAHNTSIVTAYLEHADLARAEGRVERFFLNVVLVRVLYAHALVAAPRLALGVLGPVAPLLGDPRIGMTGIFLSLSRILPDRYPLGDDVTPYLTVENRFGHLLDFGLIRPRFARLYRWSAEDLGLPGLLDLLDGDVPTYAWPAHDRGPWNPAPSPLARLARRAIL